MAHILIVEDETIIRSALRRLLMRNHYEVSEAGSVAEAEQFNLQSFDLIISDLRLPGELGTALIERAAPTPLLIMTSYASMKSAVDAMKMGARDYIAKPFDHQEMVNTVAKVLAEAPAKNQETASSGSKAVIPKGKMGQMIGDCSAMRALYAQIQKIAPTQITVLVHGESGTGKELAAQAIHDHSDRATAPLISVNCAAIPESLIESELFGHEKGAFTGAVTNRTGLVEAADGGTLFLDEIGELPLEAQARLLRVLQEREVRKVGSVQSRKVDVRLVAATHRNLKERVAQGTFREDLYYRLQVIELTLPPLREREQDVILIARHLMEKHQQRLNLAETPLLAADAEQRMLAYHWPGNIRELENAIQRAMILSENGRITADLLDLNDLQKQPITAHTFANTVAAPEVSAPVEHEEAGKKDSSLEDYFVQFVLENEGSLNETELAKKLGISRKNLWERRQRYGIPRKRKSKQS